MPTAFHHSTADQDRQAENTGTSTGLIVECVIDDDGNTISERAVGTCDGEALLDQAARRLAPGFAKWLERQQAHTAPGTTIPQAK